MAMPPRREFPTKIKLAAWKRAGGPDNPVCECGCGLPIDKANPAEYHHWHDRDDTSLENCGCVRASCHKRLTGEETLPKIKRSRRQERMEANVKAAKPKRNAHLKKYPPSDAYPRGRVEDRRTGKVVWP